MFKKQIITVVGIPDTTPSWLPDGAVSAIVEARAFAGGARHRELVAPLVDSSKPWIEIKAPLDDVFEAIEAVGGPVVVFASGDPLFFGFAATIINRCVDADVVVYQWLSSLQTLAGKFNIPYAGMKSVSLTGRDWPCFDAALIEGCPMIGVLTDRRHTPDVIAQRMLHYGYDNYIALVGEHLGNTSLEHIVSASLEKVAKMQFEQPNCLILLRERRRMRPFGIDDGMLEGLPGRPAMITKRTIRLAALSALDLHNRKCLWDIGFCTGSVSIEAKLQFPSLSVVAFERRPECESIIEANSRRMGTPGIHVVMGDFMQQDISTLPTPDAVFIGGHGGRIADIVSRLAQLLPEGGVVVLNSVSHESRAAFCEAAIACGLTVDREETVRVDTHNPISIIRACK
ncbi:MAG: precorrin-6y C5,15-methyltransferase (decarboxylating) subunit CbiE [Muribaculum sp.]|nr:precorrin-6y C5,15-methyltransferase (decarboxylating) subunit CbiE [Muribaculum sp.]